MKTTLNKIREHAPCSSGWTKLLGTLGKTKSDDEPLAFLTILSSNGIDDALWCLRSAPEYNRDSRLFAVWCARQVQHLMTDARSIDALDVAERHIDGLASNDELSAAREAAWEAAWEAWSVVREASESVEWSARAAAEAAAWGVLSAERVARVVAQAAREAAQAAACEAAEAAQKEMFIKMCSGEADWQGSK